MTKDCLPEAQHYQTSTRKTPRVPQAGELWHPRAVASRCSIRSPARNADMLSNPCPAVRSIYTRGCRAQGLLLLPRRTGRKSCCSAYRRWRRSTAPARLRCCLSSEQQGLRWACCQQSSPGPTARPSRVCCSAAIFVSPIQKLSML